MSAANILVVDDEAQIRRVLRTTLSFRGYTITEAISGEEALQLVPKLKPDLILLDVNLPGMSGVETCREIRRSSDAPIIMLTVRNAERDKVVALDAGADDYVTKPFSIQELLARVRAHLRRAPERVTSAVEAGDFLVDPDAHSVMLSGKPIHLTPTEFDLLHYLARQAGKVVTHRTLLRAVWGPQATQQNEYLRVFIGQLRKKLEADSGKQYIQTEPWVGYRFLPDGFREKDADE